MKAQMHTSWFWEDDDHDPPLSCEYDDIRAGTLFTSDALDPENTDPKLNLLSVSELFERRPG